MSQQLIWEKEHADPTVLRQMDSHEPSSGVVKFWQWLSNHKPEINLQGLEIGSGKGRNCIWLAQQGAIMQGFDFANNAVIEAAQRAKKANVNSKVSFLTHDVTQTFPLLNASMDFAIDCFASTDIDSYAGRTKARDEIMRVLKPHGLLLIYTLSTEDEYHQQLLKTNPAAEKNAFKHPLTGKFEKVFTKDELFEFYKKFTLLEYQVIAKTAKFFDKSYQCFHHWLVLKK